MIKARKLFIIAILIGLFILCFYLSHRLNTLFYDYLNLSYQNTKQNKAIEQLELEKAFYQDLVDDKDTLIHKQYDKKILKASNDNPIDIFFEAQILVGYGTLSLTYHDYLYQSAWYDELLHAYSVLDAMAHNDIKADIDKSRLSLLDYAFREGTIRSAIEASSAFGDEVNSLPETISYGTIARSVSAWETAEIFKRQTLKIHDYIKTRGGSIDYIFDASKTFRKAEGLYVDDDYLSDYYSITKTDDGFIIDLKNSDNTMIAQFISLKKPKVTLLSNCQLAFEIEAAKGVKYVHIYNVVNNKISVEYFNVLYMDKHYVVHTTEDALIIANILNEWHKDIVIKRDWSQAGILKHVIKEVKLIDDEMFKFTYLKGANYDKITEYIALK